MKDIKERVAVVEHIASNAHRRLDVNDNEINILKESRMEFNGLIQKQAGLLSGIERSVITLAETSSSQSEATKNNTIALREMEAKANTMIWMTGVFFTLCTSAGGFLIGHIAHWW